jgi:hypothetical protein
MKRLLNIRPDEQTIEQRCEGKRYLWGAGEAMDLPDNVANWMLKKLNGKDRNEQRARGEDGRTLDMAPWLKEVPIPKGELADAEKGVVRAQHKPKKGLSFAEAAQAAKDAAASGPAPSKPVAQIGDAKPSK